jgi:acetolactate synthase-1/2/3 large subunit
MDGGEIIARVLEAQGVRHVFTLCGGHISPILVGAKRRGLAIIDVRDEASAVFAADAVARMTGIPGVVAVTAGPGLTNTVTAVKNAQMAETPLIVFGGGTATVLKGRGALQDIDQRALMRPHCKRMFTINAVRELVPSLEAAFRIATTGVPGPVFVEVPVDILYDEKVVRDWFLEQSGAKKAKGIGGLALNAYVQQHLLRQFWGAPGPDPEAPRPPEIPAGGRRDRARVAKWLQGAERPVLVIGSQAVGYGVDVPALVDAVERLGVPTFLAGSARGLLGHEHELQFRHKRGAALKQADLVIIAGFPMDFRLGYGQSIARKARLVTVNLDEEALSKNRRPSLGVVAHPGSFLTRLGAGAQSQQKRLSAWFDSLRERERARDDEIAEQAKAETEHVNPIDFFRRLEPMIDDDSVLVVDGGDFVATASYVLRPRKPLSWLDPGVFGTLGVGGGFALGAAAVRRGAEVWLLWGDGSSAYSLAEVDTFVRHGMGMIAVIGNDASWAQIARDQGEILGDLCGTELRRTDYHLVAEGYGGKGLLLDDPAQIESTVEKAKALAREGHPVVINCLIGKTDFRKGSISI